MTTNTESMQGVPGVPAMPTMTTNTVAPTLENAPMPTLENVPTMPVGAPPTAPQAEASVAVAEAPPVVTEAPTTEAPVVQDDLPDLSLEDEVVEQVEKKLSKDKLNHITLAIQTETLKSLVAKVERAISKRSTMEIHKTIFFDIRKDRITVRGMNGDYTTEAYVKQNEKATNFTLKEGSMALICFPADRLTSIVKRLSAKNASIVIKGTVAKIKSGRSSFELNGLNGDEFPATPDLGSPEATIEINASQLASMYERTMYATSSSQARPILTGVHHDVSGGNLLCVSTDSHRLTQQVQELEEYSEAEVQFTVPATVLAETKKHLDALDTNIQMKLYNNQVVYVLNEVTMYARILEGNYPAVAGLIFSREQAATSFVVHAGAFRTMITNSTVYNPDQPIIMRIKPELNQLRVNTKELQVGEFEEDLAITEGSGPDVVVAVNVRYLQEAFSRYSADDYVNFEFLPTSGKKYAGLQPFKATLKGGREDCIELFVPVRTDMVKYSEAVSIENFRGAPEFDFNPFAKDFEDVM